MSPGGAEQGYSRRAALPTSVVMGSGLLLLIVLMKGLFIASGASMKPLESILTRYSHIEDDSSSGEGDDDGSAFFNPFTNVDAFDPLFSDEPDQTVRAAKRLNSFAHKAPRGMRVPDACTATLDGRRVEPGSPPLFDRLLLVTVDTRIRRTKLDHNGNCDLVWRTFAYKSTRLLVIGDEDTVGVLPLNKDRFHYTSKELMLADFLSKEAGALGPGGLQGDDAARTLVVFLDGGDVFMQGTPEDLIDCFNRMWCERGYDARDDVLILGERGIHPWHPGRYNTWNYDQSKDYPFINSGVYGGSWAAVHRMLVGTVAQIAEDAWNDDQAALHVLRLDKKDVYGKNMRLDNGCQQCFGSAYGNEPDPNAGPNGYVLDTSLGRMVHNKNKEPPGSDREGQGCSPVLMHMCVRFSTTVIGRYLVATIPGCVTLSPFICSLCLCLLPI